MCLQRSLAAIDGCWLSHGWERLSGRPIVDAYGRPWLSVRRLAWLSSVLPNARRGSLCFSALRVCGGHHSSARVTRWQKKLRPRGLKRDAAYCARVPVLAPTPCSCSPARRGTRGRCDACAATLRLQSLPQSRGTAATPSLRHRDAAARAKTAQARAHGQAQGRGRVREEE